MKEIILKYLEDGDGLYYPMVEVFGLSLNKIFRVLQKKVFLSKDGTWFQIYDNKGRLSYAENSEGLNIFYEYNEKDNLVRFKTYTGNIFNLFYNKDNKIISMENESSGRVDVTYNSDYSGIDFLAKSDNLSYESYKEMSKLIYSYL